MIAPAPTEEEAAAIFAVLAERPTVSERFEQAVPPWRVAARDPEMTLDDIRARMRTAGAL